MQKIIYNQQIHSLIKLFNREKFSKDIEKEVASIMEDIKNNGDRAIKKYAEKFDNIILNNFYVSDEEINQAISAIPQKLKDALQLAHKNISEFSKKRIPKKWQFNPRNGVELGEKFTPLNRVACYIPSGSAPLVSTVLHTATLAQIAGVKNIIATTKANEDGTVNPAILYACQLAGVSKILKLSGVYAIGALAFGTETISQVEKIVGPGNSYVTAAKKYSYGYCSLDLVAGPSEIMIIADKYAKAKFIAADLLSQLEHGSGNEQAILITTSQLLIQQVDKEILVQIKNLSRNKKMTKVIKTGIFAIQVKTLEEACQITNHYAPEHLEIMTENPEKLVEHITTAGAIFLGQWTPESVGDFIAGPSHVLPTNGSGKFFSGLTIEHFFRRTSLISYNEKALKSEVEAISTIALAEELEAHSRSATIRFE